MPRLTPQHVPQLAPRPTPRLHWGDEGASWPHHDHSRFVNAGGLCWHVQIDGSSAAPDCLLLHGTGSSAHSWRHLWRELGGKFRIIAPDLPGHAFSEPMPGGRSSLQAMADALAALLRELQVRPSLVVGHSAGAALMLRVALDGRLDGATLVGLNAALLPFEGLAGWLYAPAARALARQRLVPWLAAWRARDLRAVRRLIASTGSTLDDDGVELYARLLRSPDHVAGVLSMMANWDLDRLQRDARSMPRTLHLLAGDRDATVPPAQADRLARSWHAVRVHRLPDLGHLAHEEAPEHVAQWLRRLGRAEAGKTTVGTEAGDVAQVSRGSELSATPQP